MKDMVVTVTEISNLKMYDKKKIFWKQVVNPLINFHKNNYRNNSSKCSSV